MSDFDSNSLQSYIPVYDDIPHKWDEARTFLVEQLKMMTNGINIREIGWFLDEELLSGQQFYPGTANPQQYRSILRKVIDFGGLPATTAKSEPHGITVNDSFSLIELSASATDPDGLTAIPIPYASSTPADCIEISMDATNITITTAADYSSYTRCYVVVTYIQEL